MSIGILTLIFFVLSAILITLSFFKKDPTEENENIHASLEELFQENTELKQRLVRLEKKTGDPNLAPQSSSPKNEKSKVLSDKQKNSIIKAYSKGRSEAEIANKLGITQQKVAEVVSDHITDGM